MEERNFEKDGRSWTSKFCGEHKKDLYSNDNGKKSKRICLSCLHPFSAGKQGGTVHNMSITLPEGKNGDKRAMHADWGGCQLGIMSEDDFKKNLPCMHSSAHPNASELQVAPALVALCESTKAHKDKSMEDKPTTRFLRGGYAIHLACARQRRAFLVAELKQWADPPSAEDDEQDEDGGGGGGTKRKFGGLEGDDDE
ncbi:hypothetical protein JKP88DRAFT_264958 [Tribonema minus]|uniref:Uncharacterized protein n=1 Tax=Tribonema minus TaxID=303371 RepID=A0A835YPS1_9STRA|nr:hypothetical protein JKP88DRAFT_264958 [Tribonema minus]